MSGAGRASVAGLLILAASVAGPVTTPTRALTTPQRALTAAAVDRCGFEPRQPATALMQPVRRGIKPSIRDGSYVSYYGRVFLVTGGAPLYRTSLPSPRPRIVALSDAQWRSLRQWPRNGTFVRMPGGQILEFVGGKPLRVTSWSAVGGAQPYTEIDGNDIYHQGMGFPWDGVSETAVDFDQGAFGPIFIRVPATGRVYKLVGGSPQYVRSWAPYGGPKPTVPVDRYVVDHAGGSTGDDLYTTLTPCPRPGVTVRIIQNGQVYGIVGGAPVYISRPALVTVPPIAVDLAGFPSTGNQPNLRFRPADNSWGRSLQTGQAYVFGGDDRGPIASTFSSGQGFVPAPVDQTAIDRAGQGGVWDHVPAP